MFRQPASIFVMGVCLALSLQASAAQAQGPSWGALRKESTRLFMNRDFAGAMAAERRAMAIAEKSSPYDPRIIKSLQAMASMYQMQGKHAEAIPLYLKAIAIHQHSPDYPAISTVYMDLGAAYKATGNEAEAQKYTLLSMASR
jgi:tetratricopeptide (TPR) repeat protein